jgi:hypothetical protein
MRNKSGKKLMGFSCEVKNIKNSANCFWEGKMRENCLTPINWAVFPKKEKISLDLKQKFAVFVSKNLYKQHFLNARNFIGKFCFYFLYFFILFFQQNFTGPFCPKFSRMFCAERKQFCRAPKTNLKICQRRRKETGSCRWWWGGWKCQIVFVSAVFHECLMNANDVKFL